MNNDWEWHERGGHGCWVNAELMRFICEYSAFPGIQERHFRVYKPIEHVKNGRPLWSANNAGIGGKFSTLEAAKEFCEESK